MKNMLLMKNGSFIDKDYSDFDLLIEETNK